MMQSCFGHHFMLVLEKKEKYDGHQQFFAIVKLIGSWKQAESFIYRLQLNCHRRRLTWEATPRSIREGTHSAIMNSDCLVFDTQVAHLFAENGNLKDPRPWIESLEEIGFLYHWADYIIARYAAMNMTGSAKTWLNLHKASFTSWENIKIASFRIFLWTPIKKN
ncbi:SIAH2 [Cordylochernes scorpioides]|uniref:E3 ubiquitin-protein ligase n=1 Tax=Cordylochernes scorpioides TaxID=51811 RepID=A0ABY6KEV4_9ARAC|nr:SIAH2 [Cordylochernes scorpioides]